MMFNDGAMLMMDEREMIPAMMSARSTKMSGMETHMEGCGMGTGSADRMI